MPYNVTTTQRTHDPGKLSVRYVSFHVTFLSVSVVVLIVIQRSFTLSCISWLTAVVTPLPIKRLLTIV